jgi:hypothetical protein
MGDHWSVLRPEADGDPQDIPIPPSLGLGMQIAQIERPDVRQLQFLPPGKRTPPCCLSRLIIVVR